MNNKQRKTLEKVFAVPVVKNLDWAELEALLIAVGSERVNRGGSMVSFFLNNERADFHRPHPAKEAKPYQVRCAREFLNLAGVKP
jgi:hypothetical protein